MDIKDKEKFEENLKRRLKDCFLWVVLYNVNMLKREISKHFDIPENSVGLTLKESIKNENGEVEFNIYTLSLFDHTFNLRMHRNIEEPKEIEVPKVVKNEKKWYQFGEPDSKVIIEKKMSSNKPTEKWRITAIE